LRVTIVVTLWDVIALLALGACGLVVALAVFFDRRRRR